jgi:sterol desaturase/sphingolipid hydroxylase (fatty acid hydroxylase superfamily)
MPWMKFEGAAYWVLFVSAFFAIASWESLRPRTRLEWSTKSRWGRHAMILALAGIAQTAVFRTTPVILAALVSGSRFGLLNKPAIPFLFRCAVTLLVLDLTRYATHRAFHSVHLLWRIHEVHHSDPDYDVSTAGRFHPLEVVFTEAAYLAVVAVLAPPPIAVFAAELLTVVLNLFEHANASLPAWLEKSLRLVIITPDIHRIHHSEEIQEQSQNFGQTFCWWDRLFGTFQSGDEESNKVRVTGVKGLRNSTSLQFRFMLARPFQRIAPDESATPSPEGSSDLGQLLSGAASSQDQ